MKETHLLTSKRWLEGQACGYAPKREAGGHHHFFLLLLSSWCQLYAPPLLAETLGGGILAQATKCKEFERCHPILTIIATKMEQIKYHWLLLNTENWQQCREYCRTDCHTETCRQVNPISHSLICLSGGFISLMEELMKIEKVLGAASFCGFPLWNSSRFSCKQPKQQERKGRGEERQENRRKERKLSYISGSEKYEHMPRMFPRGS